MDVQWLTLGCRLGQPWVNPGTAEGQPGSDPRVNLYLVDPGPEIGQPWVGSGSAEA